MTIAEMEKQMITDSLNEHRGDTKLVAIALGVSRKTIYNKIYYYNLDLVLKQAPTFNDYIKPQTTFNLGVQSVKN